MGLIKVSFICDGEEQAERLESFVAIFFDIEEVETYGSAD